MSNDNKKAAKVCPQMSDGNREIMCCERRCAWWITAYTTESLQWEGCAIALQPQMVDGVIRV